MNIKNFLTKEQEAAIVAAIVKAEKATSGEIRVHLESSCKENVLDRAAYMFKKLDMHKTALRNGVLFYLAVNDRKFAILGDAGINAKVPADFWDAVKRSVLQHFSQQDFSGGLTEGILMTGEKLKTFFPIQSDDTNELPNEISFGV
ncbi:MAG: TPM domain-containing protein [Bacteroidota bacterium]|nr:TPM domain-containing protein [Bacteroidota bacterium]